eukprot:gb/GEZN01012455.1/.p1 GENE.gb/GEZN01012455.1/~~gb/GEZN01012455.1/.p1  ORF type:complete len:298 (+),score=29.77 gb/GEZN01012455.1/:103-996(+)
MWALFLLASFLLLWFQGRRIMEMFRVLVGNQKDRRMVPISDVGPHAAVYSIQGARPHMEDSYHADWSNDNYSYYAVFDGHGGFRAADFAASNLHKLLKQSFSKNPDPETCLTAAFQELDSRWLTQAQYHEHDDGSTAVVALVSGGMLHVANVGDSRGVLCSSSQAVPMSRDHKPSRLDEKQRIEALGGRIIHYGTWRVEGVLAVTRAIGDRRLKKYVSAVPEVVSHQLREGDDFLILATDGVWDVLTNEQACNLVESCKENVRAAARKITETASARGSTDNITTIVVDLRSHQKHQK